MATTYKLIDKAILTSQQSSVSFTSISQDYNDLEILATIRDTSGATGTSVNLALNSTATSSGLILFGDGTSPYSASNIGSLLSQGTSTTSNTFANAKFYLPNYKSTNAKTGSGDSVIEKNATDSYVIFYSPIWSGVTSAVTSMTFTLANAANFEIGCSFYLYGIKNS